MNRSERHAVVAGTVFDGTAVQHDCAVVIEGTRIVDIVPRRELPTAVPARTLPPELWLAPGFIDIQVNGGGDVLFNDAPTPDGIAAIVAAHRRFGTTALLPTLISDTPAKMRAAREAVRLSAAANPGVIGIHFEGPFLSPNKPGVHDPAMLRVPDTDDLALLTTRQTGVTLVTLAPEQVPTDFTARLVDAGVRVSLGHSMATYAQTKAALAQGLTGFTHLFNAMRPLASRDPGPIAAALEAPSAWFGMIVDGEHVDPAMLRLALRGAAHPILVTDAMPTVGGSKPGFMLYGAPVTVRNGRCVRADGTLAGSALSMAAAVRNCVRLLEVPLAKALTFAAAEPAAFLGLGQTLGRLAPGFRADMVAFDPDDIAVHETWVAGKAAETSRAGQIQPARRRRQ
jgi:N-acetylglucosamine-6-phosphate deacetylase